MTTGDIEQIDKDINGLEQQLAALYLKRVAALEGHIRQSQARANSLNGGSTSSAPPRKPVGRKKTKTASSRATTAKASGKKRTRMSSKVIEKRILAALSEAGKEGLSQTQVSINSGVGYPTVAKKLKELPGVQKTGSGKEGRYSLKA